MDGQPLQGRIALVTGGGRGIGRATAVALAGLGCDVAIVARTRTQIDEVAAEIERTTGRRALALPLNLLDGAAVNRMLETVRERLGTITVLVNNAAMVEPLGPSVAVDPEPWADAITLNLIRAFQLIHETLPGMLQTGWGRIVSLSSGAAANSGMVRANAYAVSKAGLEMLTRNLATELAGTGVTINAVRPGSVDTAMPRHIRSLPVDRVGRDLHERFVSAYERGALLAPELPARLIAAVITGGTSGEIIAMGDERARKLLGDVA